MAISRLSYEFVGDYKIIYNVRSVNDMTIPKIRDSIFYSSLLSSAERKYKENSVIDTFRDHQYHFMEEMG